MIYLYFIIYRKISCALSTRVLMAFVWPVRPDSQFEYAANEIEMGACIHKCFNVNKKKNMFFIKAESGFGAEMLH